jgi:hypothetical protein
LQNRPRRKRSPARLRTGGSLGEVSPPSQQTGEPNGIRLPHPETIGSASRSSPAAAGHRPIRGCRRPYPCDQAIFVDRVRAFERGPADLHDQGLRVARRAGRGRGAARRDITRRAAEATRARAVPDRTPGATTPRTGPAAYSNVRREGQPAGPGAGQGADIWLRGRCGRATLGVIR